MGHKIRIDGITVDAGSLNDAVEILARLGNRASLVGEKITKEKVEKQQKISNKGRRCRVKCTWCKTGFLILKSKLAWANENRGGRVYCGQSCGASHEWARKTPAQKRQKITELHNGRK